MICRPTADACPSPVYPVRAMLFLKANRPTANEYQQAKVRPRPPGAKAPPSAVAQSHPEVCPTGPPGRCCWWPRARRHKGPRGGGPSHPPHRPRGMPPPPPLQVAYSLALKSQDILQILDSVQRIKGKAMQSAGIKSAAPLPSPPSTAGRSVGRRMSTPLNSDTLPPL